MAEKKIFPYEIHNLEPKINDELVKFFTGSCSGFVRVGPKGYIMPKKFENEAADIYNLPLRSCDIWVAAFPRSGTTWTQELVWLIANDLDYERATKIAQVERFSFLELSSLIDPILMDNFGYETEEAKILRRFVAPIGKALAEASSPRFIKTHLPLSLLPPSLLDTSKVVFVARNPRDVAVSYFYHNRLFKVHGYIGDFKRYWGYFMKNLLVYSPFFDVVKEAWDKRDHPNMLFLFYEDMTKDLPKIVNKIADFLGKQLTEDQVTRLCDYVKFDNFKKNNSVNAETIKDVGLATAGEQDFIRKGKSGGWRDYFDEEMKQQAERWIAENLRDTDLRFPES